MVFVCQADRNRIRAHKAKREDILDDDQVSVTLDTFSDRRRAYVFSANPLGVQLDGITTEGQDTDYTFDALWYSEGRLTPDGFVVWVKIPFIGYARLLDLDIEKFLADMNDPQIRERIEADKKRGNSVNLAGTPTLFVSGREIPPEEIRRDGIRNAINTALY